MTICHWTQIYRPELIHPSLEMMNEEIKELAVHLKGDCTRDGKQSVQVSFDPYFLEFKLWYHVFNHLDIYSYDDAKKLIAFLDEQPNKDFSLIAYSHCSKDKLDNLYVRKRITYSLYQQLLQQLEDKQND